MNVPLTPELLLEAFERYNVFLSPWNWAVYFLAVFALFLVFWPPATAGRLTGVILGFLWLWAGVIFLLLVAAPLFAPAYLFAALFVVQGLALLYYTGRNQLRFAFREDAYALVGLLVALYALVGYLTVGFAVGHTYPRAIVLGAPCPVVALTFGLLLMARERVPWPLLAIPLVWALGVAPAVPLGVVEDAGLFVSGIAATALILYRNRQLDRAPEPRLAH